MPRIPQCYLKSEDTSACARDVQLNLDLFFCFWFGLAIESAKLKATQLQSTITNPLMSDRRLAPKHQFSLRTSMIVITLLCAVFFLASKGSPLVKQITFVILAANLLGFFAALIVTDVFGLPRDGSYSFEEDDLDPEE